MALADWEIFATIEKYAFFMGKYGSIDNIKRSAVKALSFRTIIIIADTIITWGISHRVDITVGFVVLTNIASTILYYLHERLWSHVHWGNGRKSK